jgi:hypothetical protein
MTGKLRKLTTSLYCMFSEMIRPWLSKSSFPRWLQSVSTDL